MVDKIINLLKEEDIIVPSSLFYKYKDLSMNDLDFILLVYLLNKKGEFYPKKISIDLKISLGEVMEIIQKLTELGVIEIVIEKNNGIQNEVISFDGLYNKLAFTYMHEEVKEEPTNLFDNFEHEFGRTLSPIEYELIHGWTDAGFSNDLILAALKEAVFNGVNNLRYIDKILFEWKKKGVKNVNDIERNRKDFQSKKVESKPLFDYDWLNEND